LLKYITAHMPQNLPQNRYQRTEMEAGNIADNTHIGGNNKAV